jgi:hypothetical protein
LAGSGVEFFFIAIDIKLLDNRMQASLESGKLIL